MNEPRKSTIHDVLRDMLLEDLGMAEESTRERDTTTSAEESLRTVGSYLLVEELGRGGSGRVYRALHRELLKPLAVKVVDADPRTPRLQRERFLREAKIAARLRHPNIVDVHDVGSDGDELFIAMDLIEGETLDVWLSRGNVSLAQRLELVEKVVRAVDFAHRQGALHRDLKPQNIVVKASGEPVIVDFGLARLETDRTLTHDGSVMGTPSYMAPEQLRGESDEIGFHSDVFALGVVLYEAITGRLPYPGESTVKIYERIERGCPVPPSRVQRGLPSDLDHLCERCLDPLPSGRYRSAAELAEDLRRVREGVPLSTSRLHRRASRTLARWKRRPILVATLSVIIAVTALALSIELPSKVSVPEAGLVLAHEIQSALGVLGPRLDSLIQRAEEARYQGDAGGRATLLADVDRLVDGSGDRTGVGAAYQIWARFLLGAPDVEERLVSARTKFSSNPVVPLMSARRFLRHYAERVEWPGQSGVLMHPVEKPFAELAPRDTEEMQKLLAKALEELAHVRAAAAWQRLPALSWIDDLCRGYELFAQRDWARAVEVLEPLAERSDLTLEARLLLSLAYCHLGDEAGAWRTAASMVEARPRLRPAVRTLAEYHRLRALNRLVREEDATEDIEQALELFTRVSDDLEADPTLAGLLAARAMAVRRRGDDPTGDYERAIELFEGALANDPSSYQLAVNQSSVMSQLAKLSPKRAELTARARERLEAARRTGGDHPFIMGGLVQVGMLEVQHDLEQTLTLDRARWERVGADVDRLEEVGGDRAVAALYRAQLVYLEAEEARRNRRPHAEPYRCTAELADRVLEIAPLPEARMMRVVSLMYAMFEERGPREDVLGLVGEALELNETSPHLAIPLPRLAAWIDELVARRRDATDAELAAIAVSVWDRIDEDVLAASSLQTARTRSLLRWSLLDDAVPLDRLLTERRHLEDLSTTEAHQLATEIQLTIARHPDVEASDRELALAVEMSAALDDSSAASRLLRGAVQAEAGRADEASRESRAALQSIRAGAARSSLWTSFLNDCWLVVSIEGRHPNAVGATVRRARALCEIMPQDGALLNTLGVGLYRAGELDEAVEVLEQSRQLNAQSFGQEHPADLAFLAMAWYRSGRIEEAVRAHHDLLESMKSPTFRDDAESKRFLQEVERVLAGR